MSKQQRVRAIGLVMNACHQHKKDDKQLAAEVRRIVDELQADEERFAVEERAQHEANLAKKTLPRVSGADIVSNLLKANRAAIRPVRDWRD
jgi:hypothetical protein